MTDLDDLGMSRKLGHLDTPGYTWMHLVYLSQDVVTCDLQVTDALA